jgi:rhodanese-related sulfurtransferase
MTAQLVALSVTDLRARMAAGRAVLVDIREEDEFARSHIAGALSHPLSRWEAAHLAIAPDADVVFTCRSGARTSGACDRLAARIDGPAYVLAGGIDGWARAGLPLEVNRKAPLEIMRQVQIAAGTLVLIGVVLGFTLSSAWFGLSAFVGAGLTFAGLSGFCGMARLLMLAPWNRAGAA